MQRPEGDIPVICYKLVNTGDENDQATRVRQSYTSNIVVSTPIGD